ncbi:hypothetical protein F5887DRAFT_894985, partial [Amanita rubescens]
ERLQKEWCSPIYAFFQPNPKIVEINDRRAHEFKCSGRGCKATVRRFLDKRDAYSTGNMRKHVKSCWGADVLAAADSARDLEEVRTKIVKDVLQNGSITAAFERKNIVTYSHRQHTKVEIRYESLTTGRPEIYIPSPETISRDVRLIYARTRERLTKMLQKHKGRLSFSTDGWTSPNHRAYVAFMVHLEREGSPLMLPLDIVELAQVSQHTSHCITAHSPEL